jgi:glycosyltransferase involved in cell wall biosynthesis
MTLEASVGDDADPAGLDTHAIRQVAVVIPVHNEEQHLEQALDAVGSAADQLHAERPGVDVQVVVVLDSCTDQSSLIAGATAGADPRLRILTVSFGSVGKSRRAGVNAVLENVRMRSRAGITAAGDPMRQTWLANTDADSSVPEHWLVRQVELAGAGRDVVLGTVEPDPRGIHHELLARWLARHVHHEDHPHIYGANLGVRASSYLAAGGFPGVDFDEDRALVDRLRTTGADIIATDTTRVLTSGRTAGRAPKGFAAYLLALTQP